MNTKSLSANFRRNSKGFTLIETLVATLLLASALLMLSSSWSGSVAAIQKSQNVQTASRLLRNKMIELEIKYKANIQEAKEEESGEFEGFPDYRWESKMVSFVPPDIPSLMMQEGGQDEMLLNIMRKMTEILEKSVKELQVTVYWKVDDKELKYNVTTLLVDYSQPIQLMGGL